MKTAAIVLNMLAALAACAPPTQEILIEAGPRPRVLKQPAYVGSGDRVEVRVIDPVWGNRYGSQAALSDIQVINRASLFGSADLKKVAASIPLQITRLKPPLPQLSTDSVAEIGSLFRSYGVIQTPLLLRTPEVPTTRADSAQELTELLRSRDAAVETAIGLNREIVRHLDSLEIWLGKHAAEREALAFLVDVRTHQIARALAGDPAPQAAREVLLATLETGKAPLDSVGLDTLMQRTGEYARRLDALLALTPRTELKWIDTRGDSALAQIRTVYQARKASLEEAGREDAAGRTLAAALGISIPPMGSVPEPKLRVLGEDLAPVVSSETTAEDRWSAVRRDLQEIQRQTERLALAVNRLPEWTPGRDTTLILGRAFEGPKEVALSVFRQPRYGSFTVSVKEDKPAEEKPKQERPEPENARGSTPAESKPEQSGNGNERTEADAADGQDGDGAAITAPAGIKAPGARDTIAVVRFDVYPRHRFHLGAGFLYSPMNTATFKTREDSTAEGKGVYVWQDGTADERLVPVAVLSYSILPGTGKIFDQRAYTGSNPLAQLGIALQAGISLANPTEEFFFGLSAEPFPGVDLGFGYHRAYLETSEYAGQFVPNSSGISPTEKRWRDRWGATTVSVDADVFVKAFASLF